MSVVEVNIDAEVDNVDKVELVLVDELDDVDEHAVVEESVLENNVHADVDEGVEVDNVVLELVVVLGSESGRGHMGEGGGRCQSGMRINSKSSGMHSQLNVGCSLVWTPIR
eukprot:1626880-Amphidinium_carterae.1